MDPDNSRYTVIMQSQLVQTLDFCRNLPSLPTKVIQRDHLHEALRRTLQQVDLIVLAGEAMSGKTEALAGFYRAAPDQCIGIFLGTSSYFRDKGYVRLVIAEQIKFLVDGVPLTADHVTEDEFRKLIYKLQKFSRDRPTYWLLDGLYFGDQTSDEIEEALDTLPFGTQQFKFIITSEKEQDEYLTNRVKKSKVISMLGVSPEEARSYLSDLVKDEREIQELRVFCQSSAGRLARVRHLLEEGLSVDELVDKQQDSLYSLFSLEWSRVETDIPAQHLLALVVFSDTPLTLGAAASLLGMDKAQTQVIASRARFVSVESEERGELLSVSSRTSRTFLAKKLSKLEKTIRDKLIDRFLSSPDERDSVRYLPTQLANAGRHRELVSSLNAEHFARLLDTERTLKALKSHAELGREAAMSLNEVGTEISFSLLLSAFSELTFSVGSLDRISALANLGMYELAEELAASAPTAEERLQLLARAASCYVENKTHPLPDSVRETAIHLANTLDLSSLGDLGYEIAEDLLAIDEGLALNVAQRALEGKKKRFDSAPSEAKNGPQPAAGQKPNLADADKAQVSNDKRMQRFLWQATRRIERHKAAILLERLKKEQVPSLGLFVCIRWLRGNRINPDAVLIADAALDFFLSNSESTPQVSDLREISDILPYIVDDELRTKLAHRIDTQYRILGHLGTSVESVRLRLQVLAARYTGTNEEIELELINIFGEISCLADVSVRSACWSWMLLGLARFPNSQSLEHRTDLQSQCASQLEQALQEILLSCANTFQAIESSIAPLARRDANAVLKLISSLNTQNSRDDGYIALSAELATHENTDPQILFEAVTKVSDPASRYELIFDVLASLRRRRLVSKSKPLDIRIQNLWKSIEISSLRFQAGILSLALCKISGNELPTELADTTLVDLWGSIPVHTVRIELGYLAAAEIADVERDVAIEWLQRAADANSSLDVESQAVSAAFYTAIKISIRLASTVCSSSGTFEDCPNGRRLSSLIADVQSPEMQVRLWANLAVRFHYSGNGGLCKEIVERKITPLIDGEYPFDRFLVEIMIAEAAPALYLTHQTSTIHRLSKIRSQNIADQARRNIISVLLQKTPLWECYEEGKSPNYELDKNSVTDIIGLLKDIKYDSIIFNVTHDLTRSLTAQRNKTRLQRNAVLDFLGSLQIIIDNNLPDSSNIQHAGFKIVCTAYIKRAEFEVKGMGANQQSSAWEDLFNQAEKISNVADRVVVMTMIGTNAKLRPGSPAAGWATKVKEDLLKIPASHDKIDRYQWVAQLMEQVDKAGARALLADGLKLTTYLPPTDDMLARQRSILDLAYMIDADLAADLVEKCDNDPARVKQLKARLDGHGRRKELASKPDSVDLATIEPAQLASICEENLARLNSGRVSARPTEEFKQLYRFGRNMPIRESAPIWEWLSENAVRKKRVGASTADHLCPQLFKATCTAAEIVGGLMRKLSRNTHEFSNLFDLGTIGEGERDRFVIRLSSWALEQDEETILISDPYFSPADLEVVQLVSQAAPTVKFRIVTSREQMKKKAIDSPEQAFSEAWAERYDFDPPYTQVAIVGYGPEGKHPIHDRWILSSRSGLKLGTSINAIGTTRISDITEIGKTEAEEKYFIVARYFDYPPRSHAGLKLLVSTFNLS